MRKWTGLVVAVAALTVSVGLAHGETLADYARTKTAPCTASCTRKSLSLGLLKPFAPGRGVIISHTGLMNLVSLWYVVDFEKRLAMIVETTNDPKAQQPVVRLRDQAPLTDRQLSTAIHIANKLWSRRSPFQFHVRAQRKSGRVSLHLPQALMFCTDVAFEFILLGGDRALVSDSSCPFADEKKGEGAYVEEADFETWFDSVLPPTPPTPSQSPSP